MKKEEINRREVEVKRANTVNNKNKNMNSIIMSLLTNDIVSATTRIDIGKLNTLINK